MRLTLHSFERNSSPYPSSWGSLTSSSRASASLSPIRSTFGNPAGVPRSRSSSTQERPCASSGVFIAHSVVFPPLRESCSLTRDPLSAKTVEIDLFVFRHVVLFSGMAANISLLVQAKLWSKDPTPGILDWYAIMISVNLTTSAVRPQLLTLASTRLARLTPPAPHLTPLTSRPWIFSCLVCSSGSLRCRTLPKSARPTALLSPLSRRSSRQAWDSQCELHLRSALHFEALSLSD